MAWDAVWYFGYKKTDGGFYFPWEFDKFISVLVLYCNNCCVMCCVIYRPW